MTAEYPKRHMAPKFVRCVCMIFGLANIIAVIASGFYHDIFMFIGGVLVGSIWFAFGMYGGLPLVDTVRDWHPSVSNTEINEMHRQGLLVMRRRKWIAWIAMPGSLAAASLLLPLLIPYGHPELIVLLVGVPLVFINFRYYLSRCPRCGLGFFTLSASRAAFIRRKPICGHCGLALHAINK